MSIIEQLGAVAVAVERGVQLVKQVLPYNTWDKVREYQKQIDIGLSASGNVLICSLWNVDLFAAVGIVAPDPAGAIATGLIASLGSTFVHELIKLLELVRKGMSPVGKIA